MEEHDHSLGTYQAFDSDDGRCKNVGQQGKRHGCHLHEGDNVVEVKTHHDPAFPQENDLGDTQSDRRQINDWKRFEGGRVGNADQERGGGSKKRTGVDRKHQDDPILIRTQDPGTPDHDTISHNILSQIPGDSPSQGSVRGCPQMMI